MPALGTHIRKTGFFLLEFSISGVIPKLDTKTKPRQASPKTFLSTMSSQEALIKVAESKAEAKEAGTYSQVPGAPRKLLQSRVMLLPCGHRAPYFMPNGDISKCMCLSDSDDEEEDEDEELNMSDSDTDRTDTDEE